MLFLGEDLILYLLLALGGALFVGNVAAILRPPKQHKSDDALERAPLTRSVVYAVIGLVAAVWAIATLVTG
ncbi:hypothetical protein BDK89_4167 [Ilumatobacter fluminis]|uniref:Uncharacterized protein n=1 Tax=Ilumatobacter fluminis TaxID=467091 RepID=A0A4R7I6V7_9ACTN|nr:hypothetical protein [Ilumatobacter fluminis]TDT18543.1 hypothetical protein BDK89_4167 [Ilumatobacter fluminis]